MTTTYLGFSIYTISSGPSYDNAYLSCWHQFDYYGVAISSMSAYSNSPTYNLCADKPGDETTSNSGAAGNFTITSIGDPSCFNEGTKILCLNKKLEEEYIAIENLRKGDLVKSYKHGYIKIDLIGKNPMIIIQNNLMNVCIKWRKDMIMD